MADAPHLGHGREFFNVLAPEQARQVLLERLTPQVVAGGLFPQRICPPFTGLR